MPDNTVIHDSSVSREHLVDLFLFQGRPVNNDPDRRVVVLVNEGYAIGFCPERLQCLWAGYRVAGFERDVDFDRPLMYYEDKRLDDAWRIGPDTFGRHAGVAYQVGHMVPNEVINRQFGRLAQLETFFMSNMSPQRGSLNGGVWLDLENKIRNIEQSSGRDHVWAIAGPVFGDAPDTIRRDNGREVPIPEAYYYVTVDPFRYPFNTPSTVDIAYFLIPQTAPRGTPLADYQTDRATIESRTRLSFFPAWSTPGPGPMAPRPSHAPAAPGAAAAGTPETRHRLLRQLE